MHIPSIILMSHLDRELCTSVVQNELKFACIFLIFILFFFINQLQMKIRVAKLIFIIFKVFIYMRTMLVNYMILIIWLKLHWLITQIGALHEIFFTFVAFSSNTMQMSPASNSESLNRSVVQLLYVIDTINNVFCGSFWN